VRERGVVTGVERDAKARERGKERAEGPHGAHWPARMSAAAFSAIASMCVHRGIVRQRLELSPRMADKEVSARRTGDRLEVRRDVDGHDAHVDDAHVGGPVHLEVRPDDAAVLPRLHRARPERVVPVRARADGSRVSPSRFRSRASQGEREREDALRAHNAADPRLPIVEALHSGTRFLLARDELGEVGLLRRPAEVPAGLGEEVRVKGGLEILGIDGGGRERVRRGDVLRRRQRG